MIFNINSTRGHTGSLLVLTVGPNHYYAATDWQTEKVSSKRIEVDTRGSVNAIMYPRQCTAVGPQRYGVF